MQKLGCQLDLVPLPSHLHCTRSDLVEPGLRLLTRVPQSELDHDIHRHAHTHVPRRLCVRSCTHMYACMHKSPNLRRPHLRILRRVLQCARHSQEASMTSTFMHCAAKLTACARSEQECCSQACYRVTHLTVAQAAACFAWAATPIPWRRQTRALRSVRPSPPRTLPLTLRRSVRSQCCTFSSPPSPRRRRAGAARAARCAAPAQAAAAAKWRPQQRAPASAAAVGAPRRRGHKRAHRSTGRARKASRGQACTTRCVSVASPAPALPLSPSLCLSPSLTPCLRAPKSRLRTFQLLRMLLRLGQTSCQLTWCSSTTRSAAHTAAATQSHRSAAPRSLVAAPR